MRLFRLGGRRSGVPRPGSGLCLAVRASQWLEPPAGAVDWTWDATIPARRRITIRRGIGIGHRDVTSLHAQQLPEQNHQHRTICAEPTAKRRKWEAPLRLGGADLTSGGPASREVES